MMHGHEKSDPVIVAGKPANKAEQSTAELVEPRAGTEGNASQQSTHRTQRRTSVSQALERIRQDGPSHTRGRSRMRESRTYGSGRGACDEARVPTANSPLSLSCPHRRLERVDAGETSKRHDRQWARLI